MAFADMAKILVIQKRGGDLYVYVVVLAFNFITWSLIMETSKSFIKNNGWKEELSFLLSDSSESQDLAKCPLRK